MKNFVDKSLRYILLPVGLKDVLASWLLTFFIFGIPLAFVIGSNIIVLYFFWLPAYYLVIHFRPTFRQRIVKFITNVFGYTASVDKNVLDYSSSQLSSTTHLKESMAGESEKNVPKKSVDIDEIRDKLGDRISLVKQFALKHFDFEGQNSGFFSFDKLVV